MNDKAGNDRAGRQTGIAVEERIRSRLTRAFPAIPIDGEEQGLCGGETEGPIWRVDPIDGTTNYLSGLPYTISIALTAGGTMLAGVVFAPLADEMFTASQNGGAHLNGEAIRASRQTDPALFILGTGLPLDGYWEGPTGYVDFAAGLLLVQEAVGVVTDFWGEADWIGNLTTTVGSPAAHPVLLDHSRAMPRG